MTTRIRTFSGRLMDPCEPQRDDIVLDDIAHALSHLCRYTGHTSQFYSVAEHSLLVALGVEDSLRKLEAPSSVVFYGALRALLHDAPEAYIGDAAGPLKHNPDGIYDQARLFTVQTRLHRTILHVVLPQWTEATAHSNRLVEVLIEDYDKEVLPAWERYVLFGADQPTRGRLRPRPASSDAARCHFLTSYRMWRARLEAA